MQYDEDRERDDEDYDAQGNEEEEEKLLFRNRKNEDDVEDPADEQKSPFPPPVKGESFAKYLYKSKS